MLDNEFCDYLEYEISKAFENSKIKELKGLWCDGVLLPLFESEYTKKKINDTRFVVMKAFIGYDGQTQYELKLNFGKYSLRRIAKDTRLEDCIPDPENDDWIILDIENRKIEIQLK